VIGRSALFVTSPLLDAAGVRHGFSTRAGGVSTGRYATLNVGGKWGDDPAHVDENRRRLADAGGFALARLATCRQVHGARVIVIDNNSPPRDALASEEADGIATALSGQVLGVYTADCVPLVLADDAGRAAAVHAGWRGTAARIAATAVETLVALGARRDRLLAALGPSICARCFEVGEEVATVFDALAPASVTRRAGEKPHVDLRLANRAILVDAGLDPARIDAAPPCTMCEPDRFFSFRRDGGQIGQHLSWVAT
jgi:YfiH family protein